jgi:hypothetical protein
MPKTPLPSGSRVHHRGCLWNRHFTEEERQAQPSWGWATIIDVERRPDGQPRLYNDGSFEYEVRYDAPHIAGGSATAWWASYHIDAAVAPPFERAPASREMEDTDGK